ncbi:MAG: hypothetical protein O3A20_05145 [Planctomycetota bacterium]|nr:hypothetical protein [Planctomycetota bacterium]
MNIASLKAEPREGIGSNASDKVRAAGRIPVILFGSGQPSQSLSVDQREFERALKERRIEYVLEIGTDKEQAALRNVQYDRMGDRILHLDFLRDPTGEIGARLVRESVEAEVRRKAMVVAAMEHQAFEEAKRKAAEAAAAAAAGLLPGAAVAPAKGGAAAKPATPAK